MLSLGAEPPLVPSDGGGEPVELPGSPMLSARAWPRGDGC